MCGREVGGGWAGVRREVGGWLGEPPAGRVLGEPAKLISDKGSSRSRERTLLVNLVRELNMQTRIGFYKQRQLTYDVSLK